jgi:hypothetical protein
MDTQHLSHVSQGGAAACGLAAALAMVGLLRALRRAGVIRLDLTLLVGTVFAPPGPQAMALGLAWLVMGGLGFGVLYATLMEFLGVVPGLLTGASFGLAHGLLAGFSFTTLPFRNRRVAMGEVADPGPFALKFGLADAAALVGGHVLYGGLFGLGYGWLRG